MKRKLLTIIMSMCGLRLFAYTTDNFLAQMNEEGYDISFVDQHENIILFLIGITLITFSWNRFKAKETMFITFLMGVLLATFALVNMILGVPYDEYLIYAIPAVIMICSLTILVLSFSSLKSVINGTVFLCIPFFYFALVLMGLWNYFIDYNICDRNVEWPSEYGLQWRPIYQGFTDKNYFESIERDVDSTDSSGLLEQLLANESHTIDHSFDVLVEKGWKIGITDRLQFFVNPSSEMGYVQITLGGGLEPYNTTVLRINDLFELPDLSGLKEIHNIKLADENNLVAIVQDVDSTCLFVSYDENILKREGFVCIKDSILSLKKSGSVITPFEDDSIGGWFHLKRDYYDAKPYLKFPTDSVCEISFETGMEDCFVVRFNNPDALEKVYSIDSYTIGVNL